MHYQQSASKIWLLLCAQFCRQIPFRRKEHGPYTGHDRVTANLSLKGHLVARHAGVPILLEAEGCEFDANLDYKMKPCLQKQTKLVSSINACLFYPQPFNCIENVLSLLPGKSGSHSPFGFLLHDFMYILSFFPVLYPQGLEACVVSLSYVKSMFSLAL